MDIRSGSDSVYVRGPLPEKEPARNLLKAADWQMREFVIAGLRALIADPAGLLGILERHRPARRRDGRPEKAGT